MITKRIIPCLDVKDGKVVKGVNFGGLQDVSSPVSLAKFYSSCGADELGFYDITASAEERARRRMAQSAEVAAGATFESILADIKSRDERDMNRPVAPLKQADDAILIDTTGLSIAEVVEKITSFCC